MAEYITIQEYADSRGISYESVRQTIKRHSDEIEGHISKQNSVKYLDEEAVRMLNEWKKIGQVVVYRQEKADYVKELEAQVQELREELLKRVSLIESLQAKIIELQIEKEAGTKLLLDKQKLEMELKQAKELEKGMMMQIEGEMNARMDAETKAADLENALEYTKKKAESEKLEAQKQAEELKNSIKEIKLETENEKVRAYSEVLEARQEAEEQRSRADQIENSYQKTIFGLYRKKKD